MIDIQYTSTPQETAAVSLQFLTNRPIVASMFTSMKIICFMLFIAFAMTAYNNAIRPQDTLSVFAAIIWLRYYKSINRWIISTILKRRKFPQLTYNVRIDDKSILYKQDNNQPNHVEWKKLKFVLKDSAGYIIPLTGMSNAGKYIWLPLRSLQASEQEFLNLLHKFKLKIKQL
jgi:hypothetical protein